MTNNLQKLDLKIHKMQNLVTENPEKIYQMSLFQGGGRGSSMIPKCPNFSCPN